MADQPCLLDTTSVVRANNLRVTLGDNVGSNDLAVSDTVVRELGQTRYDDLRRRWLGLVAALPVIDESESVVIRAEAIVDAYELHDDPPLAPDALTASAAIESGRILVTENWRDFHFVDGLAYLDIRKVSRADLPVLGHRPVEQGGPAAGLSCCRKLLVRTDCEEPA